QIGTALSDPRFAAGADDPKIVAEQQQLRALNDAQGQRASALNEFVTRSNLAELKTDVSGGNGLAVGGRRGIRPPAAAPGGAKPPPDGMPDLHPEIASNDALAMIGWYRSLNVTVHAAEYTAAKNFTDFARDCKL